MYIVRKLGFLSGSQTRHSDECMHVFNGYDMNKVIGESG